MVGANFKKQMLGIITNIIIQAHKDQKFIHEEKLISMFGVDYGISRRKMQEYLKDLENTGVIEKLYGEIFLKNPPKNDPIDEEANKILKGEMENVNV